MKPKERKRKVKRIKDIASRLSDESLLELEALADEACANDPGCEPEPPGTGGPPPDEP